MSNYTSEPGNGVRAGLIDIRPGVDYRAGCYGLARIGALKGNTMAGITINDGARM